MVSKTWFRTGKLELMVWSSQKLAISEAVKSARLWFFWRRIPAMELERKERTTRVMELVKELPKNQQEVVRLRFMHHHSYQEISDITGKFLVTAATKIDPSKPLLFIADNRVTLNGDGSAIRRRSCRRPGALDASAGLGKLGCSRGRSRG